MKTSLTNHLRRLKAVVVPTPGSNRARIMGSTVWTLGERVVTLALTFVVSIFVANYLGVSQFGQLTYTVALVTLFSTLVSGGLSGIVVRDLVRSNNERYEILGTVYVIRFVGGVLALAALIASTFIFGTGHPDERLLVAIIGTTLCFRASDVIEFWFQSQTQLRYVSIANIASALLGSAVRLSLVFNGGSLIAFAWAMALEQLAGSLLLCLMYRTTVGPFRRWRFRRSRVRAYLSQSWPLIFSGVANQLNLKVDQILLGMLLGTTAVGTYAVAARLSEVWYFVPTAIAAAVFPTLIRAKQEGEELYRRRLRQLYGLFAWGAIGVAIFVSLVGGPLIRAVYSSEYSGAVPVLLVHVWTAPFLFMGVILSKWLIIEGLLMTSLVRHGFGAILNIVLNLILIPRHGPVGSAVATLISYAASAYFACFLSRKTWPAGVDMTMGILSPLLLGVGAFRRWRAAAGTPV